MVSPTLVSIQIGTPQRRAMERADDGQAHPWYSGIFKEPIAGPVWLGRTNLEGDGQADRRFHGGPKRAVLAYGADHYPLWREEMGMPELAYGAFGENFTIAGLTEANVCMGDIYRIGPARVQVSQLRMPCWKLARRIGRQEIVARVLATGRSGWYLRVLTEGSVEAGLPIVLEARPEGAESLRSLQAKTAKQV